MIACSVQNVKKMYGGNTVFEGITFEINDNERVGLVGRNGSGKSTLFRLMAKLEDPDKGKIHWRKNAQIGYLEQIPNEMNRLTVYQVLKKAFEKLIELERQMKEYESKMQEPLEEEVLSKIMQQYGETQERFTVLGGYEIDASIEKVCNGLHIQSLLEQPFEKLSGGEKTKIGLAKILLKEPDLLLLDEPTNHLDLIAVEWLSTFLQDYPGTVVIVSHDRYFLDDVVTKIINLEDGEIAIYETNFTNYVKEKEARLLKEFQAYEEQQKKMKKMREAIKRLRDWANRANPPNEGLHKRARNMERALERMEKLDKPQLHRKKMGFEIEATDRSGKDVIRMEGVRKQFSGNLLFDQVHVHVRHQDRVAIIGENGTGKSTLLQLLLKKETPDAGKVQVGSNVNIGYLSQHVFNTIDSNTKVIEAFREEVSVVEGKARHILAKFLFYGYAVFRKVSELSGGEKMRLRLAQLMHQDVNTLVLDEPTNHLDIDSREVLEEALEQFQGTIIAVSHDRYFLDKLFERIYWIEDQMVHAFDGNYSWSREKMEQLRKQKQLSSNQTESKKQEKHSSTKQINPSKKIKNNNLLDEIEQLETEMESINFSMEHTDDISKLIQLQNQKDKIESLWEQKYLQMEEE